MILNVNTKPLNSYGVPNFTYTGAYEIVDDNNNVLTDMKQKNWRIRFLTSGELTFTKLNGAVKGIDVFIVGGGGKGSDNLANSTSAGGCGGGGGGKTNTQNNVLLTKNTGYTITIGSGSSSSYGTGGQSSAFDFSANGGESASAGSSSGAGNGGDGSYYMTSGGNGVKEFGIGPSYYGGGGGGGAQWATGTNYSPGAGGLGGGGTGGEEYSGTSSHVQSGQHGTSNTGGGGGGAGGKRYDAPHLYGGNGGSGIVIIRNRRPLSWDGLFEATSTTEVNIRSSPQVVSSPSNVIGKTTNGQKVAIYELQAGPADNYVWGKINLSDLSGWVVLQHFTYNAYCQVNSEEGAILYSSTDTSSSQILTLSKGQKFFSTAISQTNKIIWLQVTIEINGNSYSGYILNDKIKFLSER